MNTNSSRFPNRQRASRPALAALLVLAGALPALADQVIYQDLFNDPQNINRGGPYTQSLGGSAPTTRNAIGGGSASATWTYNAETGGWGQRDYGNNGVATPTSSNYLAFTPQAGHLYLLTATINASAWGGSEWFTIAFTQSPGNWGGVGNCVADLANNLVRGGHTNTITVTLDTRAPGWSNTQGLGYVGWVTDVAGTVNLNSSQQLTIDNFSLVIQNPCTLTYDANGATSGSVPTDSRNPLSSGATVTVPGNPGALAKTGYGFAGWNTAADGSGTTYNTFTISGDTTLYALWSLIPTYSVIYDGNGSTGGSVPEDGNSYINGATVTVLGDTGGLVKTGGYTFLNWNTAADGSGTTYSAGNNFAMGSSNVTLYAQWAAPVNIVGTVSDAGGPVGGASVFYSTNAGGPFSSTSVTTAGDGTYTIAGVPRNSTYYVKAGALGHLTSTAQTVSVGTGNATADFALTNSVIANGNFADNGAEYTTGPGYSSSPNPLAPMFWTVSGQGAGINGAGVSTPFGPTTQPGGYYVFMQNPNTYIEQTLATTPGATYQVSYSVAGRAGYPTGSIRAYVSSDGGTTDVGGLTTSPVNTGSFQTASFYFIAPAATTLVIKNTSPAGGDYTVDVRAVTVTAVTLPKITGTVRGASGGAPLSGATVYYATASGGPYATVTTASDGTYQVSANVNATCYLKAGASTCFDSAETSVAVATSDVGGIDISLAPRYVWNNGANTGLWNTTDANWNPWVWSNSPPVDASFTTVGGTVTLDSGIVANAVNVGAASANFTAVTLTGGNLATASVTVQGLGTNSGNYATNPTLIVNSNVTVSGDAAVGRANLTIGGGTFTANRFISAAASADWGNVTISGGTVTATNGIDGSVNTAATFQLNLNGGTLYTPSLKVADREAGTSNNAWLTFNGTTVKATADTTTFLTLYGGGQNAYVSNGGAILDTNTHNIGIGANLKNASGQTGPLTKQGTGTLTLSGTNTYTGNTTVQAGTLAVTGSLGATAVEVQADATLAGTGALGGNLTIDSGGHQALTVATTPGSQTTCTVAGAMTLAAGNILDLTASAAPATGTYILVTATGGITGTPTTVNLTGLAGTVSVTGNSLVLTVSSYQAWLGQNGLTETPTHLQAFAFGTDPDSSTSGPIAYDNGVVTAHGQPTTTFTTTSTTVDFLAVFGRRGDYQAVGLTYTVQFSAGLDYWVDSVDEPTTLATDGEIDAVSVPYPSFIQTPRGAEKPTFFRVAVTAD